MSAAAGPLTAQLFAAHGAAWPEPGAPVWLRAQQVLLDEEEGLVALLAFEALGRPRVGCDLAVVAVARAAGGPDARDDLRYLQGAAARYGALFVRPGAGEPAAVHRRAWAAPGRALLATAGAAAGAGAFGMLALTVSATEAAAALAGEPVPLPRPGVIGVRLLGEPPAGVGGAEIATELARRLGGAARGAVLEVVGDGAAALAVPGRIAIAMLGGALLGARATVFAADDALRVHLAARGRDADWRRQASGDGGFERTLELRLADVPAPPDDGAPVRVGAQAEDEDVRRLAAAAADGADLRGVELVVGGRAARHALAGGDALEVLERAGVAVRDPDAPDARRPLESGTWVLGEPEAVAAGGARAISLPALLARAGAPDAGRTLAAAAPGAYALAPGELLAPGATLAPEPERSSAHRLPAPIPATPATLRAVVLVHHAGDLPGDAILAWGPRAEARRGDDAALAPLAFPGAGAEAGGGAGAAIAVAAGVYGARARHDAAARAVRARGVRAVIAGAFDPEHARALTLQGVLPLVFLRRSDAARVGAGEELELPGVGEALAGTGRVRVRNLTRGQSFELGCAVPAAWRDLALAGGLLARLAGERAAG